MKILKSWLKDYVDIKQSDTKIADLLTFSGTLVEEIIGQLDDKIISAKILEVNPHPNADKLRLAKVDTGKGELEIVCGAPNIEAGQIVPLAMAGAKIGGEKIKEVEIRGVKSAGMLCSEKELGISDTHDGIMLLPEKTPVGLPLNEVIDSDTLFDIEITPNRGDCLSHIGVAREYAALTEQNIKTKEFQIDKPTGKDTLSVKILSPELCYQYYGIIIEGVKIGPSPDWLVARLEAMGVGSINNVVDITNFAMFDMGQPLHAFDRKKINNDSIVVRNAKKCEKIITLDGQSKTLDSEMLVIADPEKAVALAGVMGNLNSEIDEKTTSIILESAEFERKSIRKTAKKLNLTTEASYRFERGVDPAGVKKSIEKAASMILEICGGDIVGRRAEIANDYKNPWVTFEIDKINDLLGTGIEEDKAKDYLFKLGFEAKEDNFQAPSWRHDITIWQDLAEEIGRMYGLNNIKFSIAPEKPKPESNLYYFKELIKDSLVAAGFSEVWTYSFLSEKDLAALNLNHKDLLEVANPVQPENKYLRNYLVPGLLRAVAKNPLFDPVCIFEIGNVFTEKNEETNLAIVCAGKNSSKLINEALKALERDLDIPDGQFKTRESSREDLTRFKIKKPLVLSIEIPVHTLYDKTKLDKKAIDLKLEKKPVFYRPISRFPSLTRDLAFILDKNILAQDIINLIYEQSVLINRVELFDEFVSDKFGKDMKNLAFHIDLQHASKTLTDKEADEVIKKIVSIIEDKFGAKLRNY